MPISTATVTLEFADGMVKTYQVSGEVYGDLETGFMELRNENGSKFVFIPNPDNHTGKRKRRLRVLQNLKHG